MIAIDLFCGRGGWTNGLIAAGFKVYGFDINPQPEYKGIFVHADILKINAADLICYSPDFAVCSSPCEQFSVHCMKHFHPNPPYPEMGIKLFNHARMLLEELGVPYVMENVRCAEKFVGKAVNHCGPFYLWGTGVPAVMPKDVYSLSKGYSHSREANNLRGRVGHAKSAIASNMATIPASIAQAVSEGARQLVELRAEVAQ